MDTDTTLAFGNLLRRYRDSANLTQEDLARRTGLTPQAISLLERGERRRPHSYTVQKLAEALELTGQDLARFESAARSSPVRHAADLPSLYNVPTPPTSLIGRDEEVATVARLLRRKDMRLRTLTGPGGVGKTRLALRVAEHSREMFADGVVFVPLAPLRDPALVPSVLAETLGIKEVAGQALQETLTRHLQDKQMLLVLDNFEHLLTAVPVVSKLVMACPQLTVLVTSRAPLRLAGEHQFPVPPLPLPEAASLVAADVLEQSPAVELFRQRAQAVMPTFELTAMNAATVARICRRLDGLPLAIELAAARVKLFSPQVLLARLDRGLQLLTGGARDLPERQQTLRAAIAWSYDLLNVGEQALFRRLAVFAGGCAPKAVEDVCSSKADEQVASGVLETLASLIDNSLLVSRSESSARREGVEPRFTMLETIREYASERLASSGETEKMQRDHAAYYLELAEAAQPERVEGSGWLVLLEVEHDNLHAALRWSVDSQELETGARLASALWRFWVGRGHLSEGRRWLEAILELAKADNRAEQAQPALSVRVRAHLLHVAGILTSAQGNYASAVPLFEDSLVARRELGYEGKGVSHSLHELGRIAHEQADYERAARLHEQALSLTRKLEYTFGTAYILSTLAHVVHAQGDPARAETLLEESLSLFRRLEHEWGIPRTLASLGNVVCSRGNAVRASKLYVESLDLERTAGNFIAVAVCLEGLARVATMQDRPERAARLCGAAAALREEFSAPPLPADRPEYERTLAAARAVLGEDAFAAAWAKGHALPLEEVVPDAVNNDE